MRATTVLILLLVFLFPGGAAAQCAMCRAVLESASSQSTAEGINEGIVYLMIFPYILMAGVAYMIWRSRRKDRSN